MIIDKKNINKYDLYFYAYINALKEYSNAYNIRDKKYFKPIVKKLIVYGVKIVNTKDDTEYIDRETAENDFQFASIIKDLMGILTPKEFMQLYPIAKEYKGHKYGMKDYFYTVNYIKSLDQNKPIGKEILHFLWEYHNCEITDFNINVMKYMSRLRRLEGKPSLAEEFAENMGLKTYTMCKDQNGTQFLFDKKSGKTTKITVKRPKFLKVVG